MIVISSVQKMQAWSKKMGRNSKTIGFVPTMGYLHQGHLSLIRKARKENTLVVISVFVNPTQFAPKEDFRKYPRDFSRDRSLALDCGVDVIFLPSAKDMYPPGYKTFAEVEHLSAVLCGSSRPGHFRGVVTVVLKLFNIVRPDIAYFGQKDAQQAIIIKKMVKDLNLPIKLKTLPVIRERDGLAMSSRNRYLNRQQREEASILYKALQTAVGMIQSKTSSPRKIIAKMHRMINSKPNARIDYVKIVDINRLEDAKANEGHLLIALAVFFGRTRLIDNVMVRA